MTAKLATALAAVLLLSIGLPPAPAAAQTDGCAAVAPVKKKRGFGGLGKLVAAAHRAGVTDMVVANLGDSSTSQVLGAVAGAASGGQASGMAGMMMSGAYLGQTQGARIAQVTGAVTGVARELNAGAQAAGEAAPQPACAPSSTPAAPTN